MVRRSAARLRHREVERQLLLRGRAFLGLQTGHRQVHLGRRLSLRGELREEPDGRLRQDQLARREGILRPLEE